MTKEYYQNQIKYCRAMAAACKARKEYALQVFYLNAECGYKLKLNKLEHTSC